VVARVLYLLGVEVEGRQTDKPLELRQIAAITFTNKAAADLKLKLRKALRDAGRRDEAYGVDTARIGTIHAFCGDVLREFGLRRGRNPNPRVLEEGEGLELVGEVVRDTLLIALERRTVPGIERLLAGRSPSKVRGMVEQLLDESDRLRSIAANREEHGEDEQILIDLALESLTALERRLDDECLVDFDRMIVWTRDLLRHDDYARHALRRRIQTLIVDEFQDVDPAQREIAYLLGDPASGRTDTTRLMLVGDAKQSIYRFRRADVSVWRQVERQFRSWENASVLPLPENFRSKAPIIDFVDATVGRLLDSPLAGDKHADYEVPFEPLTVGNGEEQGDGLPVEVILVPTKENGKDYGSDEIRLIESDAMARRARELNDDGIRWGDMAVLLASWRDVEKYRRALERQRAPTYILRTEGFYERQEVADLIVALTAIYEPYDDRALFGFLRGPCVTLKDESLLGLALALDGTPYWRRLSLGEGFDVLAREERRRLEWGVALLQRHVAMRDRITTDRTLQSLIDESGYLAHLALMGDKVQEIANVRKLVRIARGMRKRGLGGFLQTIADARSRGDRVGSALLYGQRDDVVTITSIHAAKGLEWPVVFWCDTIRQTASWSAPDPLRGRDRIVLRNPAVDHQRDEGQAWKELKNSIDREEAAEDRRLWYVAMTRAMERLIVTGLPLGQREKPKSGTPAGDLWTMLPSFPAVDGSAFTYQGNDGREHRGVVWLAVPTTATFSAAEAQVPPMAPIAELTSLAEPKHPLTTIPGGTRHSATEMLAFARCERRHWFKYIQGLREPPVDRAGDDFIAAVKRGQIVHDVLEHLRQEDELDSLLEDAIGRWDEEAPPPESTEGARYRRALHEEIRSVSVHPEYRLIADASGARRELGFLHLADSEHCYQGKIDLVAPEVSGYALLDVKTSQCDAAVAQRKAEQYQPQRDVYVASAEGIAGMRAARFAFQFSRAGLQISESITEEASARIAASLKQRLSRMTEQRPALTAHPTECHWCGYNRVGWCKGVNAGQLDLPLG
jgi:ATP-dependent helicase/nuclease subunit A